MPAVTKNRMLPHGDIWEVEGALNVKNGGAFQLDDVPVTASAQQINALAKLVNAEDELQLVTPQWQDIDFPIIIRTTGAGIPTLEILTGNLTAPMWQVNDVNICEGQELVHSYKEGAPLYWHIHLLTNGSEVANKYVRFEVEYAWANINGVLSAAVTINSGDLLIPANTADKTMLLLSMGNFTPTNGKIGGHVWARLKRVAASGAAPALDPYVTMLQAHIQVDTLGSAQIGTK